jgi:flagellar basal body-associated protein FliL
MAEKAEKAAPAPAKSGGLGKILLPVGLVLVAAIAGLATYLFALAPMLAHEDPAHADAQAHVDGHDDLPHHPETIALPDGFVNVIRDGDMPAAMLVYGVSIECNNHETRLLVEAHLARFVDIINKLHDSRTRAELDDTLLIKESIQRQASQKVNDLLRRLQEEPRDDIKITAVLHHKFAVQDPI